MGIRKRLEGIKQEHTCAVCSKVVDELPGICVVDGCAVCKSCWEEAQVWTDEGDKICQNCKARFDEQIEKD